MGPFSKRLELLHVASECQEQHLPLVAALGSCLLAATDSLASLVSSLPCLLAAPICQPGSEISLSLF